MCVFASVCMCVCALRRDTTNIIYLFLTMSMYIPKTLHVFSLSFLNISPYRTGYAVAHMTILSLSLTTCRRWMNTYMRTIVCTGTQPIRAMLSVRNLAVLPVAVNGVRVL